MGTFGNFIYAKSMKFILIECFRDELVPRKHIAKCSVLINLPFRIFSRKCLEFKHHHNRNHILKGTPSVEWEWVFFSMKAEFSSNIKKSYYTFLQLL